MSRVDILNQVGRKDMYRFRGPMVIDRTPTTLDISRISDWNTLCDEIDDILQSSTTSIRCYKLWNILPLLLITFYVALSFVAPRGAWSSAFLMRYLWLFLLVGIFLGIASGFIAMKRVSDVMKDVAALLESRGSSRVRYELEEEVDALFKQYYVMVQFVTEENFIDEEEQQQLPDVVGAPDSSASATVPTSMIVTEAIVVESNNTTNIPPTEPNENMTAVAFTTEGVSSVEYSTTTTNNTNTGATTSTSIFDQLNSGVR